MHFFACTLLDLHVFACDVFPITNGDTPMSNATKTAIREAVKLAMAYWPNAHLGDYSRREDMRSAFVIIRSHAERGNGLVDGIHQVLTSAYRHADM